MFAEHAKPPCIGLVCLRPQ